MKEMVYGTEEVLDDSEYKGYHYVILSLSTHPAAYVEIPKGSSLYRKTYEEICGIDCHYGLTYSTDYLTVENDKVYSGWFIGWDYAHSRDYYHSRFYVNSKSSKKWTTYEIVNEVRNVIEQIIKIDRGE